MGEDGGEGVRLCMGEDGGEEVRLRMREDGGEGVRLRMGEDGWPLAGKEIEDRTIGHNHSSVGHKNRQQKSIQMRIPFFPHQ